MTLAELAAKLRCRLEDATPSEAAQTIIRVNTLDDAGLGDVTFLTNPKFASKVAATKASAIVADESLTSAPCPILRTAEPSVACAAAIALLTPAALPVIPGVHALAFVDPSATLGADVSIGPFAYVGAGAAIGARTVLHSHVGVGPQAQVGEDCVLHAHASVRDRVLLGHRVTLQNGAVIGSEGFGFATKADGTHQKIPQVGIVVIGDDVEIGANSTVDRPAIGETRIGSGTKIDNLVHIAHGVKIGTNVRLAALVGIAGSSVIEDDVVLAGQVGVINHVRVGRGAQVASKSAVMSDLEGGKTYAGIPAVPIGQWRRWAVQFRKGGKGPL
ncbi:MAG TPA: UDP-3-O-(3-hydroxymyristoyl)glucosamine N-acyltransferase [Vicinamibacterales bacterium]|nr:UDP-3-O-(3-hydroxymyristoyl)glucosamine N-acyltransferase [Vicinamibacterales bacterium]